MDGYGSVAGRRYDEHVFLYEDKGSDIAFVCLSPALAILIALQLHVVHGVEHLIVETTPRGSCDGHIQSDEKIQVAPIL